MEKQKKIKVQETEIHLYAIEANDFFSITDIAKRFNAESPADVIANWMRNKDTVEFLGTWEMLNNLDFKLLEFEEFKIAAGANRFVLSPTKWVASTNAIGIRTKSGRHGGGTFAHKDIAMAFCYWLSPTFQLYIIKEFQRLKEEEAKLLNLEWDVKRIMAKASYPIHTEAVRQHLIPPKIVRTKLEGLYFANEADLLNVALFGMTAKDWKLQNPELKGNLRDHATHEQLLVLSLLQGLNAKLMEWGSDAQQRLELLNKAAIEWIEVVLNSGSLRELPGEQKKLT
ncbi:MAG: KilA-N domain-containing protein [Saprospiraceae bacterium]|jgi:hypothetical protein|nr:KilA-N domain-containing protein [Saprospiraceae bacterium]